MSVITAMLNQVCVYWPPAGDASGDDFDSYGRPQWTTPVELACRWSFKQQNRIRADGTTYSTKAKVFLSQDVRPGGVLRLGTLSGVDQDDPKSNDGAWEILDFEKVPDFKAKEYLRKAYL